MLPIKPNYGHRLYDERAVLAQQGRASRENRTIILILVGGEAIHRRELNLDRKDGDQRRREVQQNLAAKIGGLVVCAACTIATLIRSAWLRVMRL